MYAPLQKLGFDNPGAGVGADDLTSQVHPGAQRPRAVVPGPPIDKRRQVHRCIVDESLLIPIRIRLERGGKPQKPH